MEKDKEEVITSEVNVHDNTASLESTVKKRFYKNKFVVIYTLISLILAILAGLLTYKIYKDANYLPPAKEQIKILESDPKDEGIASSLKPTIMVQLDKKLEKSSSLKPWLYEILGAEDGKVQTEQIEGKILSIGDNDKGTLIYWEPNKKLKRGKNYSFWMMSESLELKVLSFKTLGKPESVSSAPKASAELKLYENKELGFSLNIPKEVSDYTACEWLEEENSFSTKEGIAPIKVYKDKNEVIISPEYLSVLSGKTEKTMEDKTIRTNYSKCARENATLEKLKDANADNPFYNPSWHIAVEKVKNDSEIDKVLKDAYGKGCSLGEKKATKQAGVFDIEIKGDGKSLDKTECPLNYVTSVKYAPSLSKLIHWDYGQEASFWKGGTSEENVPFDGDMADSFKFLGL